MKYLLLSTCILLSLDSYAQSGDEKSQEIAAVFPLPSTKTGNQENISDSESGSSSSLKNGESSTKKEDLPKWGDNSKNAKISTSRKRNLDMALRVAYFRPDDSRYRRIYHDGWADFQIEAAWRQWTVCAPWANFSYFQQGGHSTCQHHYTQVISAMFTTGAKKFFCEKSRWNSYLGAGIGFDYKHFHDRAYYVHKNISRWSPVLIAKSGLQVKLPHHMFFDFFLDYAYIPVFAEHCKHGIHQRGFNSGGLFVGGGFGARF